MVATVVGRPRGRIVAAVLCVVIAVATPSGIHAAEPDPALVGEAKAAMRRAAGYFAEHLAVEGGYVYYETLDGQRFGEGKASPTQIWVQPPGTPTVGEAYLCAYEATGERLYLDAATAAGHALARGQLASGGWLHHVEFDPTQEAAGLYRLGGGRKKGRNYSTFDDDVSTAALNFLLQLDRVLKGSDPVIAEATTTALDAILAAQFANGAFPQVWTGPVEVRPVLPVAAVDPDWRSGSKIKEYWYHYTLNDGAATHIAKTLVLAARLRNDERAADAVRGLGDFLILSQLPPPRPAWAQQYDAQMRPAWARKFEPPAISGLESQDAMGALLLIAQVTNDRKYLAPVRPALAYLETLRRPDGRLARFYEIGTGRPLYMTKDYKLADRDDDLPTHYGFVVDAKLDRIAERLEKIEQALADGKPIPRYKFPLDRMPALEKSTSASEVRAIVGSLDERGRWLTSATGERIVGQPKFKPGDVYVDSGVFARNLTTLAAYVAPQPTGDGS